MKKKIHLNLKFLAVLVCISILMYSCQEDDFYQQNQNSQSEMKIKKVSLKDIMLKPEHKNVRKPLSDFKEKISLKNNQSLQAKLVYNEEYGIYIDDENGVFIEKEGIQSYTFRISRPNSDNKLENIVFKSDLNGNFEPLIATYDITQEEIDALGKLEIQNRDVHYSTFDYQTEGLPTLICVQTWVLTAIPPDEGDLTGGNIDPDFIWILHAEDCSWVGSGSGNTSPVGGDNNGNTPSNGHGSNPNINNGSENLPTLPILTTPITKNPNQTPNPYQFLVDLLNTETYNLNYYINDLALKYNNGETNEVSYSFKRQTQPDGSITYSADYREGTPTAVKILTGTHNVAIHLHPKDSGIPGGIFSMQDMCGLLDLHDDAHPYRQEDNEIALLVLSPDPQDDNNHNVYAIAVKNKELLRNAIQSEWQSPKWESYTDSDERLRYIQDDLADKYIENKDNLEAFFLQYFSNYGISLYKLINGTWVELGLTNTGTVVPLPNN